MIRERWFRFYNGVVHDPKVQKLPDRLFKTWVNLLCLASENNGVLKESVEDLAFSLRQEVGRFEKDLAALKSAGLLEDAEDGLTPHNWSQRQFKSDVSTSRVKAFRERKSGGTIAVSETVDETFHGVSETERNTPEQSRAETESEAEQSQSLGQPSTSKDVKVPADADQSKEVATKASPSKKKRGTRLPDDFRPKRLPDDFLAECDVKRSELPKAFKEFQDHYWAKDGADALSVDWDARWRNWVRRIRKFGGYSNGQHGKQKPSDRYRDISEELTERFGDGCSEDFEQKLDSRASGDMELFADKGGVPKLIGGTGKH